ncbi:MAG: hypothetical protein IJ773_00700 [Lachnospiraceae bacterium]|nr:hypothetical protein [Lachnospiraceae bacterium]
MGVNKVKPTVQKGVAKVPVVMQLEALECGAAALCMVMAYYEKWVPLEQVRVDCGVSRDGSKAKNIYLAAEHYGFKVKAIRMSPETLREKGQFPCIIHWDMNHFVVLYGFKGKNVYINDPGRGTVKISWEDFDRSFTGVVIIPVPGENFRADGKRRSRSPKRLIPWAVPASSSRTGSPPSATATASWSSTAAKSSRKAPTRNSSRPAACLPNWSSASASTTKSVTAQMAKIIA